MTGKDRSYKRSIYKMLNATEDLCYGLFEFQSLGSDVVEAWKDRGASKARYQMVREYKEFRLATDSEISLSLRAKAEYKLTRLLKKLEVYF